MTWEEHKRLEKQANGEDHVVLTPAGRSTDWDTEHERVLVLQQENVGLREKVAELKARLAKLEGGNDVV